MVRTCEWRATAKRRKEKKRTQGRKRTLISVGDCPSRSPWGGPILVRLAGPTVLVSKAARQRENLNSEIINDFSYLITGLVVVKWHKVPAL
jgi:hypothetical protein